MPTISLIVLRGLTFKKFLRTTETVVAGTVVAAAALTVVSDQTKKLLGLKRTG